MPGRVGTLQRLTADVRTPPQPSPVTYKGWGLSPAPGPRAGGGVRRFECEPPNRQVFGGSRLFFEKGHVLEKKTAFKEKVKLKSKIFLKEIS